MRRLSLARSAVLLALASATALAADVTGTWTAQMGGPDGDGFTIADELARGYSPIVRDEPPVHRRRTSGPRPSARSSTSTGRGSPDPVSATLVTVRLASRGRDHLREQLCERPGWGVGQARVDRRRLDDGAPRRDEPSEPVAARSTPVLTGAGQSLAATAVSKSAV